MSRFGDWLKSVFDQRFDSPAVGARFASSTLPCHGCAHSAAGASFPGFPSGERPCGFCVRNPGESYCVGDDGHGLWYDGQTPAVRTPMDCYIATDRLQQERVFAALDRIRHGESTVEPRGDGLNLVRSLGWRPGQGESEPDPCCDGLTAIPLTKGHSLDCSCIIGYGLG